MRGISRALVGVLLLGLVLLSGTRLSAQEWEKFRAAYPYHIQAIALSGQNSDGGRTMIISEPPPSVTLQDIKAIDPALSVATTRQHRLGVDGWVKDVVVRLPPVDPGALNSIVNRLQLRLFGTSYKAYVMGIPEEATRSQLAKLNLRVTSGDLRTWVFGHTRKESWWAIFWGFLIAMVLLAVSLGLVASKKYFLAFLSFVGAIIFMINTSGLLTLALVAALSATLAIWLVRKSKTALGGVLAVLAVGAFVFVVVRWQSQHRAPDTLFTPLLGGKALSCSSILGNHRSGVFVSTKPGLVLWSFTKSSPLDTHVVEIRQFALDSDLVLGAVSSSDQVAIVARERTSPVAMLPPLRTETILQLAAAREDELSQSYERKNPFAGRYDRSENMDWAPIYLSPRLIDTEYGSLLNITDQLLKGWTEHGEIEYVNFTYPKPASFPFPKALSKMLGTDELTFNWNTKGTGYVTNFGDYEVYALNQTGSLPIDYLAEGKPDVQKAEDTAYQYYSEMSDPNLIRVVQYAAMYQIFHHYSVIASANPTPAPVATPSPLLGPTRELVREIPELRDADIERAPNEKAQKLLLGVRDGLRYLLQHDPDGSFKNALIGALASRDGFPTIGAISDEDTKQGLWSLLGGIQDVRGFFVSPDDRQSMLIRYALLTGGRNSLWIHTPSIVESKGSGDWVGGHNLSSRITTFDADETIAAGKVTVDESGAGRVIHYNPADDGRIGDTVRNAAREDETSADQVRSSIESALGSDSRKPVSLEAGLGFDEAIRPDPMRGFQTAHAPDSFPGIGWRRGGEPLSRQDSKLLSRLGGKQSRSVLVARDSNGAYVISAPPADPVQAFDFASSTDAFLAVTGDSPDAQVAIHFRGFDDRQAEGFLRNIDSHSEVHVSVGSTEEYVSAEKLTEILNGKYDWNRAEVVEEPRVILADDQHSREIHTGLSVPALEANAPGLIVRLKITIANAAEFTQQMLADLTIRLKASLSGVRTGDDARIVARALVDELKKDRRFSAVQAQVKHDDKTIFYVKQHEPSEWEKTVSFAA